MPLGISIWKRGLTTLLFFCRLFLGLSSSLPFLLFLAFLVSIAFRSLLAGRLYFGLGLASLSSLRLLLPLSFLLMDLAHLDMAFVTILIACFISRLHLIKLFIVIVKILLIDSMYACLVMVMFYKNST